MKTSVVCVALVLAGCAGEDGKDGVDGTNGTNATVTAGDGLTLTGDTLAVNSTVVRQSGTGDITIAGAYKYMTPKPSTLAIQAAAFVPRFPGNSLADYIGAGAGMSVLLTGAGNETLVASVSLPNGAHITSMTCQVRDTDGASDFSSSSATLYSTVISTGTATPDLNLAISSTGTPGLVTTTANAAANTVDNTTKYYSISVLYSISQAPTNNTSLQFHGCQIAYEVDGPT